MFLLLLQNAPKSAAYALGQDFGRIFLFILFIAIVIWVVRRFFGKK